MATEDTLHTQSPLEGGASPLEGGASLHPAALSGLKLFNSGDYYEAHEALEDAWREERGPIRILYQGILQVAVTYLHIGISNYLGAVQLSERAFAKLDQYPGIVLGVDVSGLRVDFFRVMAEVQRLGPEHLSAFDRSLFRPIHYTSPNDPQ